MPSPVEMTDQATNPSEEIATMMHTFSRRTSTPSLALALTLRLTATAACLGLAFLAACGSKSSERESVVSDAPPPPPISIRELALPQQSDSSGALFERVESRSSGLIARALNASDGTFVDDGPLTAGGLALGDVNGDGTDDVLVVSGPGPNQLFLQTGPLQFEDVSQTAGIGGGDAWGTGAAFADIDRDQDLDLLVCNYDSPNQCFLNDGNGIFTECAATRGLDTAAASLMPAFADYDKDGDLDVYILTNRLYREGGGIPEDALVTREDRELLINPDYEPWYKLVPASNSKGRPQQEVQVVPKGQRDLLLRNLGDGTFEDVSNSVGEICLVANKGLYASWIDLDHDGYLDLYVTNEEEDGSQVYLNDGQGAFRDVTSEWLPYTVWSSRGSAVGDVDVDGFPDIVTLAAGENALTSLSPTVARQLANETEPPPMARSVLWQNTGRKRFRELATAYGLTVPPSPWGVLLGDYDHDGVRDLIISSDSGLHAQRASTTSNIADGIRLESATDAWGLAGIPPVKVMTQGDLDADGDLDVIARATNGTLQLWQNTAWAGTRLTVELVSTKSPMPPIGAQLHVETSDRDYTQTLIPGSAFQAGQSSLVSFSLPGDVEELEKLVIYWPHGGRQEETDIPVNSHITLVEPDDLPMELSPHGRPLYSPSEVASSLVHREQQDSDSTGPRRGTAPLGPGMACADVNRDGLDDVFLSGAAGSPGQLFMRRSKGFRAAVTEPFLPHAASEDLGAIFADFNADGHLDLYVVSGGAAAPAGASSYRDRVYTGNSRGGFVHAPEALPDLRDSGSCVSAADFDHDGDLDLFVGGGCVPGNAQEPAASRVLVNQYIAGQPPKFTASPLTITGHVTSAVWSDFDQDGWIDLLFTDGDRGVRLLHNTKGVLNERPLGLSLPPGKWSALVPWDSDSDGAIDYTLLNLAGESGILKNNGAGQFEWVTLPRAAQWAPARNAVWLDANGDDRHDLFVVQNQPVSGFPAPPTAGGVGQAFQSMVRGRFQTWATHQSGFVIPGNATAIALTDLNGDGAPDFLVARNNAPVAALEKASTSDRWVSIRFHGPLRNVSGTGSRVVIEWAGRRRILTELYSGGGYLAQNPNRIFFRRPSPQGLGMVKVTWPDGTQSQLAFSQRERSLLVRHSG